MITICLFKGNIILTKITSNRMIKILNNIGKNVKFSEYIYIYIYISYKPCKLTFYECYLVVYQCKYTYE